MYYDRKIRYLLVFFLFFIYFFLRIVFILKIPPIWRDEAVYSEIVYNIINHNKIGLEIWGTSIPGASQHFLTYPPLFLFLLSIWLKVWGFTIYAQRSFNILGGAAFLVTFYILLNQTFKNLKIRYFSQTKLIYFLIYIIFILDSTFFVATTANRPEIFVLTGGIWSLIYFQKSEISRNIKVKEFFMMLSGFLAGVTLLLHFIGIIFFLSELTYIYAINRFKAFNSRGVYFFLISFFGPVIIWVIYLISNFELLKRQVELIFLSRSSGPNWYQLVFSSSSWEIKIVYICYILVGIIFMINSFTLGDKKRILFILTLLFSWTLSYIGRIQPYAVLPLPFVYVCLTILALETLNKKIRVNNLLSSKGIPLVLLLIFLGLNLNSLYQSIVNLRGSFYSYETFSDRALDLVPPRKKIYLATIPNLYYAFKKRGDNQFYQFPDVPISKEVYLSDLSKVDYIIYNGPYEGPELFSVTQAYVQKNATKFTLIDEPSQYGAVVIELKPKDQRVF